jgi:hypothetical protein
MIKRTNCTRRICTTIGVTAMIGLLVVPGALGDLYYTDRAGDAGAAPDITDISVLDDAAGNITFTVATNQRILGPDAEIAVYVDSDRNSATGHPIGGLGADHFFSYVGGLGLPLLAHVVADRLIIDFNSTLRFSYDGELTARINKSDVGDTRNFRFLIEAEQQDADGETIAADFAPDGGFLEYALARQKLTLTLGKPARASGPPKAGKSFMVSAPVTRSDGEPFVSGKVVCRASVGAATLRTAGRVADGAARCSMRIPAGAKGKTLRGTLTVSVAEAAPVTRAFAFRIG